MEDGPCVEEDQWTGKCVFYEDWAEASEPAEVFRVDRATELPGGLVFTDIAEYSLVGDLKGEPGRCCGDDCEERGSNGDV